MIDHLPNDVLGLILMKITPIEILKMSCTCRTWCETLNNFSWRTLYVRFFPGYVYRSEHQSQYSNTEWRRMTLERFAHQHFAADVLTLEKLERKTLAALKEQQRDPVNVSFSFESVNEALDRLFTHRMQMEALLHTQRHRQAFLDAVDNEIGIDPTTSGRICWPPSEVDEEHANLNVLRNVVAPNLFFYRVMNIDPRYGQMLRNRSFSEFALYFSWSPAPLYFRCERSIEGWSDEAWPNYYLWMSTRRFPHSEDEDDESVQSPAIRFCKPPLFRESDPSNWTTSEYNYEMLARAEIFHLMEFIGGDEQDDYDDKENGVVPKQWFRVPDFSTTEQRVSAYERVRSLLPAEARPRFILFLLHMGLAPLRRPMVTGIGLYAAVRAGLLHSKSTADERQEEDEKEKNAKAVTRVTRRSTKKKTTKKKKTNS